MVLVFSFACDQDDHRLSSAASLSTIKGRTMEVSGLTANDVLAIIGKRAQWCRENGDSDMRNILNTIRSIKTDMAAGKSREEIIAEWNDDEED